MQARDDIQNESSKERKPVMSQHFTDEEEAMIKKIVAELGSTDDAKELLIYKDKLKAAELKIIALESKLANSEQEIATLKIKLSADSVVAPLENKDVIFQHKQMLDITKKLQMAENENQTLHLELKRLNATLFDSAQREQSQSHVDEDHSSTASAAGMGLHHRHVPQASEPLSKKLSLFASRICAVPSDEQPESEAMKSYRESCEMDTCLIL